MPIHDAQGRTLAALSLWTVGDEDLIPRLMAALPAAQQTALDIQTGLGQSAA